MDEKPGPASAGIHAQIYAWEQVMNRLDDVYEQAIAAEQQPQEAHTPQLN